MNRFERSFTFQTIDHGSFGGAVAVLFNPLKKLGKKQVRDLCGLNPVLARVGALEVRLATTKKEIRKAQKLRWRVFFKNGPAQADGYSRMLRRDICEFDDVCDHLIVIDHDAVSRMGKRKSKVVGVYRLLRQEIAQSNFGFYSASEFDVAALIERHPDKRFLELGRSCVLPEYRGKRTLELLWRGIWIYASHHRIDAMFGCASLEGIDPAALAQQLSFLHHTSSGGEWSARAVPWRHCEMNRIGAEEINPKRALASLPPLVKGYLRLGATFGDGAVVDRQFGTTDVFVVMPVANISQRYVDYFSTPAAEANMLAA